ncbi:hypothetical protein PIB30_101468 [Stylosanthes scabra]|uniref:Uncharacterized protein n=1 Tax=Stylosanthes scabra TaxID=79078 RepID=A0ABU6RXT2_9FABA|nr:hypothetical protein [Stylosanthes scabra]
MVNIDPKTHGTTFYLDHAILIYVLMTEGVVNLPRIMRDVLLKRPTGNSRNLLPYPIFISRLATRYQVPEFPGDEIYRMRTMHDEKIIDSVHQTRDLLGEIFEH